MKRMITERERALAQLEIDVRMRMVRMGLLKSLSARILDETNDGGEVVIEYNFEPVDQIAAIEIPPAARG